MIVIGLIIGFVAGFIAKTYFVNKKNNSFYNIVMQENEKLKKRTSEMQEQIERLNSSNAKHRNAEKESDDEIENLEDELKNAKQQIKTLKMQNEQYKIEINDYKNAIASLQK